MMSYRIWDGYGMMGSSFGILPTMLYLIILIDAVLLGIWLWKQIQKK